jgi:hypothetical protein
MSCCFSDNRVFCKVAADPSCPLHCVVRITPHAPRTTTVKAAVMPGRYFQLVALMIAAPRMALIGAAVFS